MNTYLVTITYEIKLDASDEDEAVALADGAITTFVHNPITGEVVTPNITAEEILPF